MVKELVTAPLDVYENMAFDELLAETYKSKETFLRFFNWRGGFAATFGYAQFYNQVSRRIEAEGIREYSRRPTGGGIVFHGDDITFSLVFADRSLMPAREIYAGLHGEIMTAFSACASFKKHCGAGDYRPSQNGAPADCFASPVKDDLLGADGNKILGGAIRRFGNIVLYQGSFRFENARGNAQYAGCIRRAAGRYFGSEVKSEPACAKLAQKAAELAGSRYRAQDWLRKF
jgi:lipoate-protein ligase A